MHLTHGLILIKLRNGFNNITDKEVCKFIQVDIDSYYSSVNPSVLNSALIFAKNRTLLSMRETKAILAARKSVIEFDNKLWIRKETPNCFDMTMGSLNAAQLNDEVGIYLLHMISLEFLDIKEGIYRGDAPFLVKKITSIGKSKKKTI